MEFSTQLSTYHYPSFGVPRCDWGLTDDVTKFLFNYFPLKNKLNLFQVCKHWFDLANSYEAGEALLRNACLHTEGKMWMPTFRFFQEKVLYFIFVDFSGSMQDKVGEKQIEKTQNSDKRTKGAIPAKTRLEIAKAKVLDLIKPLSFPLVRNKVYCGQFGKDCNYKNVTKAEDVTNYFKVCYVNTINTNIDVLYEKIRRMYDEIVERLKLEDCSLDVTILSDFDCKPTNQNVFDCKTEIRYIRIDNDVESLKFQKESLVFYNQPEIFPDTQDYNEIVIDREIEVIEEEIIEKELKRKLTTEIAFVDVNDEFPKRPLKKIKTSEEGKNCVTMWSTPDPI